MCLGWWLVRCTPPKWWTHVRSAVVHQPLGPAVWRLQLRFGNCWMLVTHVYPGIGVIEIWRTARNCQSGPFVKNAVAAQKREVPYGFVAHVLITSLNTKHWIPHFFKSILLIDRQLEFTTQNFCCEFSLQMKQVLDAVGMLESRRWINVGMLVRWYHVAESASAMGGIKCQDLLKPQKIEGEPPSMGQGNLV